MSARGVNSRVRGRETPRTKATRPGRGAFSLIELLVVVSVITLLAAIMLPGLARAREYAYFTRCKNNLRQIAIGFLVAAAEGKGRMPEAGPWPCDGQSSSPEEGRRMGSKGAKWVVQDCGGGRPPRKDIHGVGRLRRRQDLVRRRQPRLPGGGEEPG
ncbi:type II secretion system protein [Planctomycetota bacterium]